MAVMFYDKGDHPAGFIGFRVVRTVGTEEDYRQKYYGLSEYSYQRAESLAHKQDEAWALEAEAVLKDARINKIRGPGGSHIIANGLRAAYLVENKDRGGEVRTYINPAFLVKIPGHGKSDKAFRIGKAGYRQAYAKAVVFFCKTHDYDNQMRKELLDKIPPPSVFLDDLAQNLRENGHEVDMYELYDKLGVVFVGNDRVPVIPETRDISSDSPSM